MHGGCISTLSNPIWSSLTKHEKVPFGLTFVHVTLDHNSKESILVNSVFDR